MIRVDSENSVPFFDAIAAAAFSVLHLSGEGLIELNFASEDEMRYLNRSSRAVDRVTDVLSFPSVDKVMPLTRRNYPFEYDADAKAVNLGSIVICESVALSQAEEYGHSPEREKGYLFLHGLLHLLGYDHMTDADKNAMREKEETILAEVDLRRD